MRFVIKYPTRGRPGQFIRQVQKYRAFLSRRNPVRFVVSIDEDDRTMHAADVKAFISRQRDMKVYVGASKGKIEAVNADFEKLGDYDVLILASDDMVPQVRNYDVTIEQLMMKHFPNLDGCLHFDDGLNKHGLNTMPIAGKKLIDSWGYIYHPSYRSEFCDNEFQDVTERDGKSVKSPLCLFKHEWAKTGKDATFIRNSNLWCVDKPNYERRKAAGFPK